MWQRSRLFIRSILIRSRIFSSKEVSAAGCLNKSTSGSRSTSTPLATLAQSGGTAFSSTRSQAQVGSKSRGKCTRATNALTFAYLDPYNLEHLSFGIIRELAKLKSVDFAVRFSTMDLSRNVEMEFDPARARFDDTAPGWRENVSFQTSAKAGVSLAFFN